jgi:hypothetical protein
LLKETTVRQPHKEARSDPRGRYRLLQQRGALRHTFGA